MRLPISWLNEYVDVKNISEKTLCDALVGAGFEVEEIIRYSDDISGVVTGKILKIDKHENADKLKVCTVDLGNKTLVIVTGANNVTVGDVVPVALDGANLSGKIIKSAPLRGVMSYGMMCSGAELKTDDAFVDGASVDGILLLDKNLPLGQDVIKLLNLNETVLDVAITANRADCHSILGLAREVSAALNIPMKYPSFEYKYSKSEIKIPSVTVISSDCAAYTSALVTDVKIEPSPKWMQRRLYMCGVRPINNVVDITNYVLMEVGQPLHAFDLNYIDGNEIIVRRAAKDEEIIALNGEKYSLDNSITVICDARKPLAIAGVMGGEGSGIKNDTKNVFLESARFLRGSVRATSRKLGLRSDSSARFERGVDYYSIEAGRKRALSLFAELGAGKPVFETKISDVCKKIIKTSQKQIDAILGISVPVKKSVEILSNLGFEVNCKGSDLTIVVPAFREDIDNFTDIAEEVIRFYGCDKLNETMMRTAAVTIGGISERQKRIDKIKEIALCCGYYEIMTYSFTDKKVFDKLCLSPSDDRRNAISILNPITEDLSVMKTELVSGMISVISINLQRKNSDFRLMELAKVYTGKLPLCELPNESSVLCIGAVDVDFYDVKSVFTSVLNAFDVKYSLKRSDEPYLHPGISADIVVDGEIIGSFGKLHPSTMKNFGIKTGNIFVGSLQCEKLLTMNTQIHKYSALPKFPPVERDLALVVNDDVCVGEIIAAVQEANSLIKEVRLFDVYKGEQIEKGHKSIAIKFKIVSYDKTLVDSEIVTIMDSVIDVLSKHFDAKVRA